jgi:hypothetical protein
MFLTVLPSVMLMTSQVSNLLNILLSYHFDVANHATSLKVINQHVFHGAFPNTGTVRGFGCTFTLEEVIEFHAFAPLVARACVCPMAFLSGVHSSYQLTL